MSMPQGAKAQEITKTVTVKENMSNNPRGDEFKMNCVIGKDKPKAQK